MVRLALVSALVLSAGCGPRSTAPAATPAAANAVDPGAMASDAAPDTSVCANADPSGFGPVVLDATQAAGRYGLGARRFADAPTTQQRPIEVCGVGQEMDWLSTVTCADGSHPFGADPDADRVGSVGAGGRCGTIIDLYQAACPEATYPVYMDMYLCGPGESFM